MLLNDKARDIQNKGRGWHGDPEGHREAGRKGGQMSSGKFKEGSEWARRQGRKGGESRLSSNRRRAEVFHDQKVPM